MNQNELLAIIDRAAREGWIKLDLRFEVIKELPPEISRLTNLQSLNLSNTLLTTLPPEIVRLTALQSLNLSSNVLTTLPPEIVRLTTLQSLNLSDNQLRTLPAEICRLANLQSLALGINQLTTLPLEIIRLTNLQYLNLSRNPWTILPREVVHLTNLQSLHLSSNQLVMLPPEIAHLSNLQTLNLSNNQLRTLPPEIVRLTNLQTLELRENQLTTLPPEIAHLTNLQHLDLWNNQLTTLPSEIVRFTNLQSLVLGFNQLMALPPEIGRLANLQSLDVSGHQLIALPPEIGWLANLQSLYLSNTLLTTLPPEIGRLTNLQFLDLAHNQLTTLPPALRRLSKLKQLHLYGNPLPLPAELPGSSWNPGDPQAILDAYFQISRPLREAKLLLVGQGKVGKTPLVERLLSNRPPSDSGKTVGVDIHRWQLTIDNRQLAPTDPLPPDPQSPTPDPQLRINIWDFGGQDIYHATHQFFLTHRSLYLVVLESRKDEDANRLDYWLRHVASFAGDAPVIVVANKTDRHRLTLDERGLMLKYPNIRAVVHTSCTEGTGIDALRHAIEQALAAMPHLNDWIPVKWFAVKEKLEALARQKDYLPYDRYIDLCLEEDIEHEAAQRTLARFLHDLGTVLNFQDDRRLAGTNVLNPEWVAGGIYHILNAKPLQGRGLLDLPDLDAVLDHRRYPAHKHPFLLDIMRKFELCVPLGDGRRYLIPGLLPKERPAFPWPGDAPTALEYRYAILPASVLSRLMVRLHRHTWRNNGRPIRWLHGLVLTRDDCRALVIADATANRLTIALDGPPPQTRQLLSIIRAQLDEIHASFARLEAEEWVPIPSHPDAAIRYRALLNLEARGVKTYYDPNHDVELNVPNLLNGIDTPQERQTRTLVNQLLQRFNEPELRHLCFNLDVNHEDLPYTTRTELARELVLHLQRHGRLPELEKHFRPPINHS